MDNMTGQTMAEKILESHTTKQHVEPGEHITIRPDWVMAHDLSIYPGMQRMAELGHESVWDPDRVIVAFDHHVPVSDPEIKDRMNEVRDWIRSQNITHFFDSGRGISHNILAEEGFSLPGQVLVGSDSHTTTHGAFGTFATGIGHTDLGSVLGSGELWVKVPETRKLKIDGSLPDGSSPKDLALQIMGELTAEGAIYEALEYQGSGVESLSIAGRQTLTNLAVELGASAGLIPPDSVTESYLEGRAQEAYDTVAPDDDASYVGEHVIDAGEIEPLVAKPSAVDNIASVSSVAGTEVDQVFLGTCNNGRFEDIQRFASVLTGESIAQDTDLIVVPGSKNVLEQMYETDIASPIVRAGGMISTPGCGPCFGAHGGVLGEGDTCLGTMNRNFPGRMGPGEIYIGSPETAAATAIYGEITDPGVV